MTVNCQLVLFYCIYNSELVWDELVHNPCRNLWKGIIAYSSHSCTGSQIFESTQPTSLHDNLCTYEGFGEFVDPLSCNFYYACTNSRTIRMPCPHGLFFQPSSNTTGFCDFEKNVACTGAGVRPEHPVFVTTTTTTPDPTEETVKSTYHPRNYH